jgi:hypothetical protein
MYFLCYLGDHLKSDEVIEVLEHLDMEVIYAFDRSHENIPDAYWAAAHSHGFQFRFDEKQILDTIFLYLEPDEGFEPLAQDQEYDVPFFSFFKEAQAHGARNGWPAETGKVDFLGVVREWIRFRFEEHTVHYEFRKEKLAMVTLSRV